MTVSNQGKIITFYSYKGGTGRSMALANIAWILASNSKRVLVVDWDLEAPGLQRYFRPFLIDRELTSSAGVVDLITDFILAAITPVEKGEKLAPDWFLPQTKIDPYLISLNWKFPSGGRVDFMPAGRQGPDYGARFSAINWQKFYDVLGGGAFIEQLKINMRSQYDYILVDSRTGVSDTSGICTIQLPDTLVVCFTFNNQSIEGAAAVTQGVFDQRTTQDSYSSLSSQQADASSSPVEDRFYLSPFRFKVFPVPMRVEQAEKDKLGIRQAYSRYKFDRFLDQKTVIERRSYWGTVSVPYVPYFSYEEILAVFKDDPSDPNTCLAAFTRITGEISDGEVTGIVPLLDPEQRDEVLQEFASVPALDGESFKGTPMTATIVTPPPAGGAGASTETEIESSLRRAETTFRSLKDEEREQARLLWTRVVRIPRLGENTENSKVRVPLKDLGAASVSVIEKFADAGVMTVSKADKTGEPIVEATNEELLRSWPTLQRWIDEDRELLTWRQDLQSSMAQWQRRGGDLSGLLFGHRLWTARRWFKSHPHYLSDNEVGYILTSVRFLQRVLVFALVVLVATAGIVYFGLKSSDKILTAKRIADIAESQITSAKNQSLISAEPFELGLLLATEAEQLAPTAKAEDLLKTNLSLLPRRSSNIPSKSNVLDVALSPNASQVLSVTGVSFLGSTQSPEDRMAQLQNVSTGEVVVRVPFKQGSGNFQLSPDARYVAIVSGDQNKHHIDVFEAAIGRSIVGVDHGAPINDMAFSPDGSFFATASADRRARIVRISTASSFDMPYGGSVTTLKFSGNSRHIAIAGGDSMVHILRNLPSSQRFSDSRTIRLDQPATQFALSYDGRYLATITLDKRVVSVWDVETERLVKVFNSASEVSPVWFAPDDTFVLAAGAGTIYMWSLFDANDNHMNYETGDAVGPSYDEKYFVVVGNNIARIWNYGVGNISPTALLLHKANIQSLRFGNQDFIVTASADNLINIWKVGNPVSGDLKSEACSRLTRNMTIDEWNKYIAGALGSYRKTCSDLP